MSFTFSDMCCGIGGFHLACTKQNGICKIACDISENARNIYNLNFSIKPYNDIRTCPLAKFDLLCCGFPCTSFSTLGNMNGIKDSRGKVFFYLLEYIKNSKPKCILLENVIALKSFDAFQTMIKELEKLEYHVNYFELNAVNFGVPQNRQRLFIVCTKHKKFDHSNLMNIKKHTMLKHILDLKPNTNLKSDRFNMIGEKKYYESGFILRAKLTNYTHMKLFSSDGICGTIATASPPVIYDERYKIARNLSIKELLRLQSFPSTFKFPDNNSRSKKIFHIGNAVCVNVIEAIIKELKKQQFL